MGVNDVVVSVMGIVVYSECGGERQWLEEVVVLKVVVLVEVLRVKKTALRKILRRHEVSAVVLERECVCGYNVGTCFHVVMNAY